MKTKVQKIPQIVGFFYLNKKSKLNKNYDIELFNFLLLYFIYNCKNNKKF